MPNPEYPIEEELREAFDYFREKIILEIQDTIKNKKKAMESIKSIQKTMNEFVSDSVKKEKLLESLATVDLANLWTDEGRALIKKEHKILHELLVMEENIRRQLNELRTIELSQAIGVFNRHGGLLPEDSSTAIRTLIMNKPEYLEDLQHMGMLYLITLFDYFHIRGTKVEDYLGNLLTEEEIQDLINGKIKKLIIDFSILERYNRHETNIVRLLDAKVREQNQILTDLLTRIPEKFGQKTEANEQVLLQQAIQIGGLAIETSLPREHSPKRTAGFQTINSANFSLDVNHYFENVNYVFGSTELLESIHHNDINEAIGILLLTKDVYKDVEVEVKGRFGFGSKKSTERKYIGQESMLHHYFVQNGSQEPAYMIGYLARDGYNDRFYKDYSNRYGTFMYLFLILPESIAKNLFNAIKRQPTIIRNILDQIATNVLGISSKAWFQGDEFTRFPLRPPYEQWKQKERGSKIYIKEIGQNNFNPSLVYNI